MKYKKYNNILNIIILNMDKIIENINKNPKYIEQIDIKDLVKLLKHLSNAYYNTGKSLVSDNIFDLIKETLELKDPKNKYLKQVGAPVLKHKVKLPFPMGSLDKIKPDTVNKWKIKYKGPYVLSDKLDGISAQIYKNSDGIIKLYTRGNGIDGQDISHLIDYLFDKKIINKIPIDTSIRGEIIISKDNFKTVENFMANARNAVSGLVNSKSVDKRIANISEFIAYSIIYPEYTQYDQLKLLTKWNFKVVEFKIIDEINVELLNNYLIERKNKSNYNIDGIVVVDTSTKYKIVVGNPEHAVAYKNILDEQVVMAKVVDVIWKVSKDGLIKPIIQIEPVNLMGSIITFATAFNGKYVVDNKLGPNAIIKIVKSGDVIPHILQVVKHAKEPKMPNYPYEWSNTNVDLKIIKNNNNEKVNNEIIIKNMVHFFKTLNIKYINEGLITKFVENKYNSIEKLLLADKNKLNKIEGVGDKLINKIFDNINKQLLNTKLEIFMAASNKFGSGMGIKKLNAIIENIPNIMTNDLTNEELYNKIIIIKGFQDKTTKKFINNFNKFKKFYKTINDIIDISYLTKPDIIKLKNKKGIFYGLEIVFTGFRNANLEQFILKNGGKINNSVTKKTNLLIYLDKNSSKYNKAIKLNINVMHIDEFNKKYMKN